MDDTIVQIGSAAKKPCSEFQLKIVYIDATEEIVNKCTFFDTEDNDQFMTFLTGPSEEERPPDMLINKSQIKKIEVISTAQVVKLKA